MISLIIPIYNQAGKLTKLMASIQAQTYQDFEVILVNDGSTDELKQVLNHLSKPDKFQYLEQTNQGAPRARNKGAQAASGEYFLFLDADIVMNPQMLAKLLQALTQNQTASYAYSNFYFGAKHFKTGPFSKEKLKQGPFIHTSSLLRAKDFPGFDPELKRLQDWDLWLTMLAAGHSGVWVDETLFRVASGGTMSAWLPKLAYKLLPGLKRVKDYQQAIKQIKHKHKLL